MPTCNTISANHNSRTDFRGKWKFEFVVAPKLRSVPELPRDPQTMALHSSTTARETSALRPSEAQENQEPAHIGVGAKSLVGATGALVKVHTSDQTTRTLRRALHSIDSNRPRPVSCSTVNPVKRPLSNEPLHDVGDPVEAEKLGNSSHTALEAIRASESQLTGHKRSATTADNESKTPRDATEQWEQQESENLAWMDMMLALLEKRYGGASSLPVCLTDLEAANQFQLPQQKKHKTGIVASRSSVDSREQGRASAQSSGTCTSKTSAINSLNLQQIPARFEGEQTKETKRQRLLLRHAQQIQASSVSSSTSCGCKTGCLKMYCMCFSSRGYCHAGCGCGDCKNGRGHVTERVEAIQNYLANDPRAFSFASVPQDASTSGFLHLLPQKSSAVVMRGCRCKKSKCLKKYCECFQNGIACTSNCRCMDCSNHSKSTAAHQHPHLQKGSVTASDKRPHSSSFICPTAEPKPFHAVQITVTKQPRRNRVGKTLRLNL